MADQERPNQAANKSKAEGERWTSEPGSVRQADRDENPEQLYDDQKGSTGGGITNRPLSDEVGSQEALPDRGTRRDRSDDPGATEQQGDFTGEDR